MVWVLNLLCWILCGKRAIVREWKQEAVTGPGKRLWQINQDTCIPVFKDILMLVLLLRKATLHS